MNEIPSQRFAVQPLRVLLDKRRVARLLGPLRNLIQRLVPGNVLPVRRARPPHLRLRQPPRIQHVLLQRRSLRAQRPAIRRMIGIAFHVNHLRRHVLRLIPDRINQHAATHRAIRTRRACLGRARNFQFFQLGVSRLQVKSEDCGGNPADRRYLEEISAGRLHSRSSAFGQRLPIAEQAFLCLY